MVRRSYGYRSAVWVASISSSVISPPITAYDPTAHSKSAIAPFARSCALAGISSVPAGMVLGLWSWRALSNRSRPAVPPRSPSARIAGYLIGPSSVAHVDGHDPLGELRQIGLLPGAEVAAATPAEEHRLGLEAGIARPRVEVPAGERHQGSARSDGLRPDLGQRIGHRHLAQLEKARVVDVEVRDAGLNLRDAYGVGSEGGEVFRATDEQRAPDAGVAVELLVAGLEVQQPAEAQPVSQRDRGDERSFDVRDGAAEVEVGGAAAGNRAAVAVVAHHVCGVAIGVERRAHDSLGEPGADGIAHAMFQEGAGGHRREPGEEAEDLVAVRGQVEGEVHARGTAAVRPCAHEQLDPLVQDRPGVDVLLTRKPDRRRDLAQQNLIRRPLAVIRELESQPVVPEARVEAELDLLAPLRPQIRVSDVLRRDRGQVARPGRGGVGGHRRVVRWGPTRLSVCRPQPHLIEERGLPERLLADHPARTRLGVVHAVEVGAEGALVVGAEAGGEKQAIAPGHLLLAVEAEALRLAEIGVARAR